MIGMPVRHAAWKYDMSNSLDRTALSGAKTSLRIDAVLVSKTKEP